jgi:uroporphyrinogen decarboxylase
MSAQMRLVDALNCKKPDRVPFVPAIYEHKAWFIGETPSNVCRDADLFTQAVLAEYEQVRSDGIVIGIDVYNVEAEAAGSRVKYFEAGDSSIPAVDNTGFVLGETDPVSLLKIPNPKTDGRMPVHLETARRVVKEIGRFVPVRGAISGPFSMAANVAGAENLFMQTLLDPQRVREVLHFAAQTAIEYAKAYVEAGCGVIIFDSQASPVLLSPDMYREFVLERTKEIISSVQKMGVRHVPLIIGGDTTPIVEAYVETGGNNILCDFSADNAAFLSACSEKKTAYRRNIDPRNFLKVSPDEVHRTAMQYLEEANGYPGFILGTGVVPYGTPTACLAAARSAAEEFGALQSLARCSPG